MEGITEYPSFFYDVNSETVIVGDTALDAHLEMGGHPADIVPLAQALIDKNVKVSLADKRALKGRLDREKAITDGWFLVNLVHEYDPTKTVTSRVMDKAWNLGIIEHSPSQVRIPSAFGKFIDYQHAIGETNIFRRNHFDHLTYDDLVEHIKKIAQEEGQKPTIHTLSARIEERGLVEPSPSVIRRLIKPKTIYDLYQSAGLAETSHSWSNEQYELFGVSYMWANRGRVPSAGALNDLSRKGKGPSQHLAYGRYGSLSEYQDRLIGRFNDIYTTLASEMGARIEQTEVPIDLIRNARSEWEAVIRYIRYKAIEQAVTNSTAPARILSISRQLNGVKDSVFEEYHPEIEVDLIKLWAQENGLVGAIWPRASGLYRKEPRKSLAKVAQPQNGSLTDIKGRHKLKEQARDQHEDLRKTLGDKEALKTYLQTRGADIRKSLEDGSLPIRLFRGARTGRVMARRYEAYALSGVAIPGLTETDKIRIAILSDEANISQLLRKQDAAVTSESVRNLAAQLGFILTG